MENIKLQDCDMKSCMGCIDGKCTESQICKWNIKNEIEVSLDNLECTREFLNKSNEFPCNIDASRGNYTVDAKSLLGILYMSTNPFTIKAITDDIHILRDFYKTFKEYEV